MGQVFTRQVWLVAQVVTTQAEPGQLLDGRPGRRRVVVGAGPELRAEGLEGDLAVEVDQQVLDDAAEFMDRKDHVSRTVQLPAGTAGRSEVTGSTS
jgi:hypothetical protein